MHDEAEAAYAITAIVCAFLGAATGILTKRGMALTLTAVVLSYAPDWTRGLAGALVGGIWYVIVWLPCRDRRTRREERKVGKQQRSPAPAQMPAEVQLTSVGEEDYEHGCCFEHTCFRNQGSN
jgi:hypothetical protein